MNDLAQGASKSPVPQKLPGVHPTAADQRRKNKGQSPENGFGPVVWFALVPRNSHYLTSVSKDETTPAPAYTRPPPLTRAGSPGYDCLLAACCFFVVTFWVKTAMPRSCGSNVG